MDIATLTVRFLDLLPDHRPMDWEAEEYLEAIASLDEAGQEIVLAHVPVIWPVSHSLCYSYLSRAAAALACLAPDQVEAWVAAVLDMYEHHGLHRAQAFMADVENNFLCRLRGEAGVTFREMEHRLQPYAAAIAGRTIHLVQGPELYTDTASIFLPREIALFPDPADDFLLYKLMITTQLGFLQRRTYESDLAADLLLPAEILASRREAVGTGPCRLENFLTLFDEPRLAEDLFTVVETTQIHTHLATAFPGLWRDTEQLRADLAKRRPEPDGSAGRSAVVEALYRHVLVGRASPAPPQKEQAGLARLLEVLDTAAPTPADSAIVVVELYQRLHQMPGPYVPVQTLFHVGRLHPAEAGEAIRQRRVEARERFVKALAAVLPLPGAENGASEPESAEEISATGLPEGEEGVAIMPAAKESRQDAGPTEEYDQLRFLVIDNRQMPLPEPLRDLARSIVDDLGHIPSEYISAAQGLAGRASPVDAAPDVAEGEAAVGPLTYDEWDFRRHGFRRDWCVLLDKNVAPVKGTFVAHTLEKYRGLLLQLKKQFEMLRRQERFVRRQRDGDDIDLDAMVEAIGDARAGRPPSERLFIRLLRDQRDIAALFLVDMSSSTEGWVGQALKEALILMGEALEVLGDRFAIYGFSGMRRLRSDFYRIKDFSESYNREIKGRIAAIAPQEYTRMGPPLRHAARLLSEVEAKVRLLIVLSDGKPEDYDDYKGEYAVEDTRHALIEAKAAGIHPFCITIDRRAHDYIDHMYGEVNYIFVDDVRKLPARLPEIYRHLTT